VWGRGILRRGGHCEIRRKRTFGEAVARLHYNCSLVERVRAKGVRGDWVRAGSTCGILVAYRFASA